MNELTERELGILIRLADGMTRLEIAAELNLSTTNIRTLMRYLYEKLQAKTAAHAVAMGYHRGILIPKKEH